MVARNIMSVELDLMSTQLPDSVEGHPQKGAKVQ